MPEYVANAVQTVDVGQNVLFTDTVVPCNSGFVYHREGSGLVTLRGIVNGCGRFARYKVTFSGNITVPAGGAAGPISITIAIDGEPVPGTNAAAVPAAVGDLWNVSTSVFITVPKGCCLSASVENAATVPIEVSSANLIVERVA